MDFGNKDFNIEIMNTGKIVHNMAEYVDEAGEAVISMPCFRAFSVNVIDIKNFNVVRYTAIYCLTFIWYIDIIYIV